MIIKSRRFVIAIVVGMMVTGLIFILVRQPFWGPLLGVAAAAYLARVSSPRQGALVGSIVLTPMAIYSYMQAVVQTGAQNRLSVLTSIFLLLVVILFVAGLGALYGLVIGKLFQITKDKNLIL